MEPISPIRISADGRHFIDTHGAPTFWLGDTLWELFRCFCPETALEILRKRRDQGFNVILIMLTGVDHTRLNVGTTGAFANIKGDLPWLDDDPLRPNARYFEHIDTMIRLGEQTGQTFVVGIYHQWHRDLIPVGKARGWARWIANRYRDVPNLIWSMYPRAEAGYVPVCRELAAGLQEGDGGAHLISVHPDPAVASSSFLHQEPWLAFNMIQTCVNYEQIPDAVMADYAREPAKPVVMAEGGYEGLEFGKVQGALEIRQQAFWTQLAGGHHVYGHNDAWTAPERWRDWIDAPGAQDLLRFKDLITGIEAWWQLIPDPGLRVVAESDQPEGCVAARSEDGQTIVAYLGSPARVTLRLPEDMATKGASVRLIRPAIAGADRTEQVAPRAQYTIATPDGWQDTLVIVRTTP